MTDTVPTSQLQAMSTEIHVGNGFQLAAGARILDDIAL